MTNKEELLPFCECGECGLRVTKPGNRFINGHNKSRLGKKNSPEHCAALSKARRNSKAVKVATEARRGVPHSHEHCANLSKSLIGRTLSPEHCDSIKKALENSEAVKSNANSRRDAPLSPEHIAAIKKGQEEVGVFDAQRGGHDIVKHHYLYDHNNPNQQIVEITRAEHTAHHHWMRRNGLKVPHINVTESNKNVFGEYKDEQ